MLTYDPEYTSTERPLVRIWDSGQLLAAFEVGYDDRDVIEHGDYYVFESGVKTYMAEEGVSVITALEDLYGFEWDDFCRAAGDAIEGFNRLNSETCKSR